MAIPLTAREPIIFTPPSLRVEVDGKLLEDQPVKIWIRVPTPFEKDSFDAALQRAGVVYYTREQIRSLMRAGVAKMMGDKFEETIASFEELWQSRDAEMRAEIAKGERLIEMLDENEKKPEAWSAADIQAELDKIQPDVVIAPARAAEINQVQMKLMTEYEPLRIAIADGAEAETKRSWYLIENFVRNFSFADEPEMTPDGSATGGLQRHEAEWLRVKLGDKAWDELDDKILSLHGITSGEEKNLASLLEKQPVPIGSPAESTAETAGNDGSSTDANIESTPGSSSPRTNGKSIAPTKRAGRKTARSARTPTAARGATSP